jgi:hypothetical protein
MINVDALEEMLQKAELDIRRHGLLEENLVSTENDEKQQVEWTQVQFWYLLKEIARRKKVDVYHRILCFHYLHF